MSEGLALGVAFKGYRGNPSCLQLHSIGSFAQFFVQLHGSRGRTAFNACCFHAVRDLEWEAMRRPPASTLTAATAMATSFDCVSILWNSLMTGSATNSGCMVSKIASLRCTARFDDCTWPWRLHGDGNAVAVSYKRDVKVTPWQKCSRCASLEEDPKRRASPLAAPSNGYSECLTKTPFQFDGA